ncbi:MAG: hypothetical protein ACE5GY_04630 [Thermodesulfobacteriota bacterium]
MAKTLGYLHNDDLSSEIMAAIAAVAISIGIALPLWGLAVIALDFFIIFLPVLVVVGLIVGVVRVMHHRRQDKLHG